MRLKQTRAKTSLAALGVSFGALVCSVLFLEVRWQGSRALAAGFSSSEGDADSESNSKSNFKSNSEGDANPEPPRTTDPELRRVRSVPLPGRRASREGVERRPSEASRERAPQAAIATVEAGYGVVRKPDVREAMVTYAPARSLLLNGVDISAVRGETLENVTVTIDDAGNIALVAPHYEVGNDTSFHPLLPTELPKLPKERKAPLGLPEGVFRKEGNQAARSSVEVLQDVPKQVPVESERRRDAEVPGRPLRVSTESDDLSAEGVQGARALPAR